MDTSTYPGDTGHGGQLAPVSALAHVSLTRSFAPHQLRIQSRGAMLALSYLIEDVTAHTSQTVLIAAFQRFSFVRPQLARYRALASNLAHAYVIGLADIVPPAIPNVTYLPIEAEWPLMHEWVVVANGPECSAALLARDPGMLQPARRSNTFSGMWNTNMAVVDATCRVLGQALGIRLTPNQRDMDKTERTNRLIQRDMTSRLRAQNTRLSR